MYLTLKFKELIDAVLIIALNYFSFFFKFLIQITLSSLLAFRNTSSIIFIYQSLWCFRISFLYVRKFITMKQCYFFLLVAFLSGSWLSGANGKYRLILTDDPSTTITIGWDQISGHSVAVFYDIEDHGKNVKDYAYFQLPDRATFFKGMNNHFVRLKNLVPNTAYYFVIIDSEGVSERFWFKTMPEDPSKTLSIIAGGDSRRAGEEYTPHEPRIQSNRIVKAIRPDFVAFGGDFTDKDTDRQWQSWFDDWQYTTGDDGRMIPIYPARGNHERSNQILTDLFDVQYPDVYYALTFGGSLLRFYTLNSMVSVAGDQTEWLEKDLIQHDSATIWKMAHYHYTIAPHTATKPYRIAEYTLWAPLFHQHGIHMIVECDSHVAKIGWPVRPSEETGSDGGFIRDDETGTVYMGEGSWGLIRPANVEYNWTRDKGSFTQVKWIQISQDSMVTFTIKSAESATGATVSDDNRFEVPQGINIWTTENGDRVVIKRKNPLYNPSPVTSSKDIAREQITYIRNLFPNPAHTKLTIEFKEFETHQYRIFDIHGRVVREGQMRNQVNTLDISSFETGQYFLKVWKSDKKGFQVKRFIKN